VLGVAVLVVAIIALRGPNGHSVKAGSRVPGSSVSTSGASKPGHGSRSASASPSPSGAASSSTGPARQSLVVLNNTTITGLANQAERTFERGGWTVTAANNYQNDILSTCAYYDPSVVGARAAAKALQQQFPGIKRVEPQFAELASWHSPIVVILTPDWTTS
jgi:hypothetical protein